MSIPSKSKAAQTAYRLVNRAVKKGKIKKSDTCEICGYQGVTHTWHTIKGEKLQRILGIVAHHHRGYKGDAALDIWWCCYSCNTILGSQEGLTQKEAREYVKSHEYVAKSKKATSMGGHWSGWDTDD